MDKLTVLDGDFEVQLRRHLKPNEILGPAFALKALRNHPHAVYQTHLDYLHAGAQIIRTNTYRISLSSIHNYLNLTPAHYAHLTEQAVRYAKQAVHKYYTYKAGDYSSSEMFQLYKPRVAGTCSNFNISCFNNTLETSTNYYTLAFLTDFHQNRVTLFLDAQVDLLAFESIPSVIEMEAIIAVMKKSPNIPFTITFLCQQDGKLMDGSIFADIIEYIILTFSNQILAIGVNCSVRDLPKILMRNVNNGRDSKIPCIFYADQHFLSSTAGTGESAVALQHNIMQEYFDIGVRFIGGCSGTNAEDIRTLSQQVQNYHLFRDGTAASVNACSYRNVRTKSKI